MATRASLSIVFLLMFRLSRWIPPEICLKPFLCSLVPFYGHVSKIGMESQLFQLSDFSLREGLILKLIWECFWGPNFFTTQKAAQANGYINTFLRQGANLECLWNFQDSSRSLGQVGITFIPWQERSFILFILVYLVLKVGFLFYYD